MGGSGDNQIDDNLSTTTTSTTAVETTVETIFPMSSNFTALNCRDILRTIFLNLSIPELARAACVSRLWCSIATDRHLQTAAFMSRWKLRRIVGNPTSGGCFWRDNGLHKFALSHRLSKADSLASLAIKYSVQVMDIKRLNNMMSDHGIYSRERLLIPISNPDVLTNSTCYIELDLYAKREAAVLYLDGGPEGKMSGYSASRVSSDHAKKRVIESLRRSMQVDDGTAQYYLSISNGDPRVALSEFSEDLSWERQAGLA